MESSYKAAFKYSDLKITLREKLKKKPDFEGFLPFGEIETDHMFEVDWTIEEGWGTPEIKPFEDLEVDPMIEAISYGV